MEALSAFLSELLAVDWAGLVSAAVASGAGITIITQLLKARWIKVPAEKYPRVVSVVMAAIVGIFGAVASGIVLSSITSIVVFTIVAFVTSGITYDYVRGLVVEAKGEKPLSDQQSS